MVVKQASDLNVSVINQMTMMTHLVKWPYNALVAAAIARYRVKWDA